jgi:CIC family chloride channel protein
MGRRREELRALVGRLRGIVFWSAVTGLLTGLVVTGFEHLVLDEALAPVLGLPIWATAVLPLLGLTVAFAVLRVVGGGASPATSDAYLRAFHGKADLGWRPSVARLLASVATIGSGGALGLEGPSQYAGAAIGQGLEGGPGSRVGSQRRSLLVAGAAAGVGAIFKAPATGAVFALESSSSRSRRTTHPRRRVSSERSASSRAWSDRPATTAPMSAKPSPRVLPMRKRAWMPSTMTASLYMAKIT